MKPLTRSLAAACVAAILVLATLNLRAQGATATTNSGTTVHSALLFPIGGGTDFLRCSAVNVGTTTIPRIRVSILGTGHPLATGTCEDVAPNEECAVVDNSTLAGHCKVTANAGIIRAQFQILDERGDNKALLPLN